MSPLFNLFLGGLVLLILGWLFWPESGQYWRWQDHSRRTDRVLLEDAVKHIYLCEGRGQSPSLESLAGALSLSLDQASQVMEAAQENGLVHIEGGHFILTETGREAALQIIRAHRIWEKYLADFSGFGEEDWHSQADRREHLLSNTEVDRLFASLGFPTHDPHGDPIPTSAGDLKGHGGKLLTEMDAGTTVRIVHIEDEPKAVYAQIVAEQLHPGMILRVEEAAPDRMRLWSDQGEHILAPLVARNLSVTALDAHPEEGPTRGLPLSRLGEGQSGRVITLSAQSRGMDRRRLLDLGVVPGTEIQAEMVSPGGDPTAYRIRGSLIALRDEQAQRILVERMDEAGTRPPEKHADKENPYE
jgi:DtxR family Mn-dependent transcriptional regulator